MAHPQINAVTFRNTFWKAFKANPTAHTLLLINNALLEMATSLDAQADLVGAPNSVRINGTRIRDRLTGNADDIRNIIDGDMVALGISQEEAMAKAEAALFSGYPHGTAYIEDEMGSYDPTRLRGEAWEVATFYNQVGAIDNPLQATYFGEGFSGWIAKGMTQAIVKTSQVMAQTPALTDAVQKWDTFKTYVSTQTEALTKKASGWMWVAVAVAAAWAYREFSKEER